ncbi:MAG: S53 family peptidase [Ktedonobacteraceae bacterium]
MKRLHTSRYLMASISTCAVLLSILFSAAAQSTYAASRSIPQDLQNTITPIRPMLNAAVSAKSPTLLPCLSHTTLPLCYSPQQIRRAYGIQPLLDAGITGEGRTIVIIDDYQSPSLRSDLTLFDKIFDLPNPKLNIIAPNGMKPFDPRNGAAVGFSEEISLDVEWSHAVAPEATIDLVLGNPADDTLNGQIQGIVDAMSYATSHNLGGVYSLSIGGGETCYSTTQLQSLHQSFRQARDNHSTVYVSAGDSGSASIICDNTGKAVAAGQTVEYPASDSLVSGVGGTTLLASKSGRYVAETTWNESALGAGATGGGFSKIFPRPSYRNDVPGISTYRGVPDVAYNADPLTGVPVVISLGAATLIVPIGGTSAGAPQWAGITALAEQSAGKRLGFLNETFYRILKSKSYSKAFHDITTGNNAFTFQDSNGKTVTIPGYNAGTGWDATTGVGTPKAAELVKLLVEYKDYDDDGKNL